MIQIGILGSRLYCKEKEEDGRGLWPLRLIMKASGNKRLKEDGDKARYNSTTDGF